MSEKKEAEETAEKKEKEKFERILRSKIAPSIMHDMGKIVDDAIKEAGLDPREWDFWRFEVEFMPKDVLADPSEDINWMRILIKKRQEIKPASIFDIESDEDTVKTGPFDVGLPEYGGSDF